MKCFFCFALLFIVSISNVFSATWVGGSSTSWTTAANWSPASVPTQTEDISITSGSSFYPVVAANTTIRNLTITGGPGAGAALTINSGVTLTCTGANNIGTVTISGTGTLSLGTSTTPCTSISLGSTSAGPTIATLVYINTSSVVALLKTNFSNATATDAVVMKVVNTAANSNIGGNSFAGGLKVEAAGSGLLGLSGALSGNTYNGSATFINSNTGGLYTAYSFLETYSGPGTITYTNTGTGGVYPARTGITSFSKNIVLNCTSTNAGLTNGIVFGQNGGTLALPSGATITVGGTGFTVGVLDLTGVSQASLVTTPQSFTLTGTAKTKFGNGTIFRGTLTVSSPQIESTGSPSFSGVTTLTKTGATNNTFAAGYTFGTTATIANSGDGNLALANGTYTGDVTFINSGIGGINPANTGATTYNGNVIVNSTESNTGGTNGITFGVGGGTSTIVSGKTISVVASGFTKGTLGLRGVTVNGSCGSSPMTLTLSSTGTATLTFGTTATFNVPVVASAPNIFLNRAVFACTADITKNGSSTNSSVGGNTFTGSLTFTNSGTGAVQLYTTSSSIYTGGANFINTNSGGIILESGVENVYDCAVTLTNTGTGGIYGGYSYPATYNGNVTINNTNWNNSNNGIYFGKNVGGSAVFAAGTTISLGSTGLTAGRLHFQNSTINGTCASPALSMNVTTGSGVILFTTSTINIPVSVSAPNIYLNGSTFNCITNITKNGTGPNTSDGGNTFAMDATISNTSTGTITLANVSGDNFLGNATFVRTAGTFTPANIGNNYFKKDIISNGLTNFSTGGGVVILDGTVGQQISGTGTPDFKNITLDKLNTDVTLNIPVSISGNLTFTGGNVTKVITTATNLLTMKASTSVTGAGSTAFVSGPVKKIGNTAFVFPIGKSNSYMPLSISAPASATDAFQAEYFIGTPPSGSFSTPFKDISNCEYWNIQRTTGTSSVSVTLNWNSSACSPINASIMSVALYNGSAWTNAGVASTAGTDVTGSITTPVLSTFGQLALGYKSILILDTRLVNPTSYSASTGAEPTPVLTSGASGTPAGTKTIVSSSNNIAGVIVLHPDLPASPLTIFINPPAGQQYDPLEIRMAVDASNNITSVQTDHKGTYYDMVNDYYTITSASGANCKIAFDKVRDTDPLLNITTNLPDGVTFDVSDLTNFVITIPSPGFNSYALRVFDLSGGQMYNSGSVTSSPLQWNGKNGSTQCAEGVYKFEMDIVSGGVTNTYKGQLILKF